MLISQPIISAINHLLRNEPWARKRLLEYVGQAVQFKLPLFDLILAIDVDGLVCAHVEQPIAVTLTIPQIAIAAFCIEGKKSALKRIHIEGDAEFAATLSELMEQLRWEVEEDLAKLIGPTAAHGLVSTAQAAQEQGQRLVKNYVENAVEYALYEQPILVDHHSLHTFTQQVVTLRDDLSRLEKRIEQLHKRQANAATMPLKPPK
jgi:ubiquinone biosynthesis protein UbiJ